MGGSPAAHLCDPPRWTALLLEPVSALIVVQVELGGGRNTRRCRAELLSDEAAATSCLKGRGKVFVGSHDRKAIVAPTSPIKALTRRRSRPGCAPSGIEPIGQAANAEPATGPLNSKFGLTQRLMNAMNPTTAEVSR